MKRLSLLVLIGAILLNAIPALAQDGFYVVGGRYTPGTKITNLPYTITTPGYYYLTGNLSYSGGDGIIVNADDVTIDLMGFALIGPGVPNAYYPAGILINNRRNVEVRNGTVTGWYVGVSGFGFDGVRNRVIGVRASKSTSGVDLEGTEHLIKGCSASPGTFGSGLGFAIWGTGIISDCTAMNFIRGISATSGAGILIGEGTVSRNVVMNCTGTEAVGIYAGGPAIISHNVVSNCTTGIDARGGGSLISNAVLANPGQTGIAPATNADPSPTPTLLDQNSVKGDGIHYGSGNTATVMGLNSPQYIPQ